MGKGYGFVKFNDQNEGLTAINEMNGKYLCGKPIKTKYIISNIYFIIIVKLLLRN